MAWVEVAFGWLKSRLHLAAPLNSTRAGLERMMISYDGEHDDDDHHDHDNHDHDDGDDEYERPGDTSKHGREVHFQQKLSCERCAASKHA